MTFESEFEKRFGMPIDHAVIKSQKWNISKWNDEQWSSLPKFNSQTFFATFDKVFSEITNDIINKKNTTVRPQQISTYVKPEQYINKFNVLLLGGLTESANRDIGATSTTVDYIGVGTDSTAESQSQTGLISAYGSRKQFSVSGSRTVVNQTAKYGMVFTDTDLTVPVSLTEACTFTLSSGGIGHCRIQYPSFTLSTGERIVFQINELMANG